MCVRISEFCDLKFMIHFECPFSGKMFPWKNQTLCTFCFIFWYEKNSRYYRRNLVVVLVHASNTEALFCLSVSYTSEQVTICVSTSYTFNLY